MKKIIIKKGKLRIVSALIIFFTLGTSCNDFLDITPLDRVSPELLLDNDKGIKMLLADLYNAIPMEDFCYHPSRGFNVHGYWTSGYGLNTMLSNLTDESLKTEGSSMGPVSFSSQFSDAYNRNRDVTLFLQSIETVRERGIIDENMYKRLFREAHFCRAYIYFGLVKRWGGIPIIEELLDDRYVPGSANEYMYIPRSSENDSWRFILRECDLAIADLPNEVSNEDGRYRASKWAAYALKSRVALHAASIAKYWDRAPLTGEAVTQKLVGGMSSADADFFYSECISASRAIIENAGKSLYMPEPKTPEEAAVNYQYLFLTEPQNEVIFSRAYLDGTKVDYQGHDYDIIFCPSQGNLGHHQYGRFSVTLDIVDSYEDYTDDGTGKSAPIITRTDGVENYYTPFADRVDVNIPFKKYDDMYEPFKNKDARLLGSVIVPGALYKGIKIVIQGGLIGKNGNVIAYAQAQEEGKDGNTYYTYGAQTSSGYSGFASLNSQEANYTSTGFSIRKYLAEDKTLAGVPGSSYTSWIDMRLAEVYLNYAEAVAESGQGDQQLAAKYINDLRKRAGHTDVIPFSLENVLKERRVELAFEGFRFWDLFRRREYHTFFNSVRRRILVPMIDLREDTPKYIFVRSNQYHDEQAGGRTFNPINYYHSIPGVNDNRLIQNPGH